MQLVFDAEVHFFKVGVVLLNCGLTPGTDVNVRRSSVQSLQDHPLSYIFHRACASLHLRHFVQPGKPGLGSYNVGLQSVRVLVLYYSAAFLTIFSIRLKAGQA